MPLPSPHRPEFVRRAAFVIVARLAVTDKGSQEGNFLRFLPRLRQAAEDERHNVRKAVSWALRQIGKRSPQLNARVIAAALDIQACGSPAARRVAGEVLRELRSEPVRRRLGNRPKASKPGTGGGTSAKRRTKRGWEHR